MNLIVLRSSAFRLYCYGTVAAVNGMWILQILMIWLAWDVTGSASFVAMIGAFALFPTVLSGFVAPIFAGFSIERAGVIPTLAVAVLLHVLNFVIIAFLHPRDTRTLGNSVSFSSAFWQGLAYLWQKADLRAVLCLSFLFALTIRGVMEVLPVVADGQFGRGAAGVGQLGSAIGAGDFRRHAGLVVLLGSGSVAAKRKGG